MERTLSLKAGSHLDSLVHEHVMGYRLLDGDRWEAPDGEPCARVWSYSSAPAWAMIVAETLVAPYQADPWLSFALRTTTHPERGRRWHAMFRREEETAWAEGMTPEEAICLAALEAIGYRPEGEPEPPAPVPAPDAWPTREIWDVVRTRTPNPAEPGCDDPPEPVRQPVLAR